MTAPARIMTCHLRRAKPLVGRTRLGRPCTSSSTCSARPTKVLALPVAARLYRNRQGSTKRRRARPRPKCPRSTELSHAPGTGRRTIKPAASWFPDDTIIVMAKCLRRQERAARLPKRSLISDVHRGAYRPRAESPGTKGRNARRGSPARHGRVGRRSEQPWTELAFHGSAFMRTLAVKTIQALQ